MTPFERAFAHTIGLEGGCSDNPADRGGPTKYGVTERVARANGYDGPMRELTLAFAQAIARRQYWSTLRLDEVADVWVSVACELFDTGYNMGVGTAGKFLQRSLNALNQRGAKYPDVRADGLVGPLTIMALAAFRDVRGAPGEAVLLKALNALQGARYIEIAERDPSQEDFVYGWLLNRA